MLNKDTIDNKEDNNKGKLFFGSSYAEERAMLKAFSKLGYTITKTKSNYISLEINKENKIYYILGHNKYSNDRHRMSVLVKSESNQNNSILLCKSNDFSIFNLINKKNTETENEISKNFAKNLTS